MDFIILPLLFFVLFTPADFFAVVLPSDVFLTVSVFFAVVGFFTYFLIAVTPLFYT